MNTKTVYIHRLDYGSDQEFADALQRWHDRGYRIWVGRA